MKILKLESKLDIDKTKNQIEQTRIQLETIINSEDSSYVAVKYLKKQVDRINLILAKIHADKDNDWDSLLEKSQNLKQIGDILINSGNKYQESFNKYLFQQVKYLGLWFQGIGKQYEIHAFTKKTSEPSEKNLIDLIKLHTDFVENHWETHPEEIIEREQLAFLVIDAEKSSMSANFKEVSDKFVNTALLAADKARLKQLKNSSKDIKQVVDWMINSPKWQGDDLQSCLEIVKNTRIQAEF